MLGNPHRHVGAWKGVPALASAMALNRDAWAFARKLLVAESQGWNPDEHVATRGTPSV